jgi:hypothetical protein
LLQPKGSSSEHVSIRLSGTEVEELEASLRQSAGIACYFDWFLGSATSMLETITEHPEQSADLVPKALNMVLSGSRAGMDLQKIQVTSLHNITLRRRDAFLNSTFKDLTPAAKKELRHHDLDSPDLFDPVVCTQASKDLLQSKTMDNLGARRQGQATAKTQSPKFKKPWSSPKQQQPQQQHQSKPYSPPKPKGKGYGRGNNFPKKRGGGVSSPGGRK